jgi:hypothetical protein
MMKWHGESPSLLQLDHHPRRAASNIRRPDLTFNGVTCRVRCALRGRINLLRVFS